MADLVNRGRNQVLRRARLRRLLVGEHAREVEDRLAAEADTVRVVIDLAFILTRFERLIRLFLLLLDQVILLPDALGTGRKLAFLRLLLLLNLIVALEVFQVGAHVLNLLLVVQDRLGERLAWCVATVCSDGTRLVLIQR